MQQVRISDVRYNVLKFRIKNIYWTMWKKCAGMRHFQVELQMYILWMPFQTFPVSMWTSLLCWSVPGIAKYRLRCDVAPTYDVRLPVTTAMPCFRCLLPRRECAGLKVKADQSRFARQICSSSPIPRLPLELRHARGADNHFCFHLSLIKFAIKVAFSGPVIRPRSFAFSIPRHLSVPGERSQWSVY